MAEVELAAVRKERDLGVLIDDTLKFHEQTAAAVSRANRILGLINLRPGGGGGSFCPPPLWFFEDNSKTKESSITKLGIPFH